MVGATTTLETDYVTRFGNKWSRGTELEIEGKLRRTWLIGFRTPEGEVGSESIPREELPPEVARLLGEDVSTVAQFVGQEAR
jgi:hypothetical protein